MAAATTFPWFSAIKSVFIVANVRRLYPSGVEESIAQSMDENPTNSMANEETKQAQHSILVLRIILRTGVLSCVLFEILSLSCVLLSCLLSHCIAYYSQIVTLVLRIICDSDLVLPIVVLPIPEGSRILCFGMQRII